jgi:hypothetical protein
MPEVDLRNLQAASNRYVKAGFRPLPLDGKNSVQLGSDLTYDLIHVKTEVAGTPDLPRIEEWLSALALRKNHFGAPDDAWLATNADELAAFLNDYGDALGLPAPVDFQNPGAPRWAYMVFGGVALVMLLGIFGLSRVKPVERVP